MCDAIPPYPNISSWHDALFGTPLPYLERKKYACHKCMRSRHCFVITVLIAYHIVIVGANFDAGVCLGVAVEVLFSVISDFSFYS
jgi:hypothetical protein